MPSHLSRALSRLSTTAATSSQGLLHADPWVRRIQEGVSLLTDDNNTPAACLVPVQDEYGVTAGFPQASFWFVRLPEELGDWLLPSHELVLELSTVDAERGPVPSAELHDGVQGVVMAARFIDLTGAHELPVILAVGDRIREVTVPVVSESASGGVASLRRSRHITTACYRRTGEETMQCVLGPSVEQLESIFPQRTIPLAQAFRLYPCIEQALKGMSEVRKPLVGVFPPARLAADDERFPDVPVWLVRLPADCLDPVSSSPGCWISPETELTTDGEKRTALHIGGEQYRVTIPTEFIETVMDYQAFLVIFECGDDVVLRVVETPFELLWDLRGCIDLAQSSDEEEYTFGPDDKKQLLVVDAHDVSS